MKVDELPYQIDLEVFAGPFDLLLELILKQEVDIYEVPIAAITDGYLKYVRKLEELNLEVTSEFLVIAATLLELKSYALLPVEEDEAIAGIIGEMETREDLIGHLVDYITFQGVSSELTRMAEEQSLLFSRVAQPEGDFAELAPDFLAGVRLDDLTSLAQELLEVKPAIKIDTSHIALYQVSVAEKAGEVVTALKKKTTQSFRSLCTGAATRIEKIVVFLALLELFKRGAVGLSQARVFGDIRVRLLDESRASGNDWSED